MQTQTQNLDGGFTDAPVAASHAFRAVMMAMARPGDINRVTGAQPPAPLNVATGVLVLTLCDPETPVFLGASHDTPQVRDWITFHTGARFVAASDAMFAFGTWDELPLSAFPLGTAAYPDRSATLVVTRPTLANDGAVLCGPGIKGETALSLPETQAFQTNAALFPRGLDFIFTCGDRLAALPRTTRVG